MEIVNKYIDIIYTMEFKYKIILFLALVTISFLLDKYLNTCNNDGSNIGINSMHFAHHITSNYLFHGSFIFGAHLIHLLLIAFIAFVWVVYEGRCTISDIYNKACKFPDKTRHKDITYYLLENILFINVYGFIGLVILYDIYMILKK